MDRLTSKVVAQGIMVSRPGEDSRLVLGPIEMLSSATMQSGKYDPNQGVLEDTISGRRDFFLLGNEEPFDPLQFTRLDIAQRAPMVSVALQLLGNEKESKRFQRPGTPEFDLAALVLASTRNIPVLVDPDHGINHTVETLKLPPQAVLFEMPWDLIGTELLGSPQGSASSSLLNRIGIDADKSGPLYHLNLHSTLVNIKKSSLRGWAGTLEWTRGEDQIKTLSQITDQIVRGWDGVLDTIDQKRENTLQGEFSGPVYVPVITDIDRKLEQTILNTYQVPSLRRFNQADRHSTIGRWEQKF